MFSLPEMRRYKPGEYRFARNSATSARGQLLTADSSESVDSVMVSASRVSSITARGLSWRTNFVTNLMQSHATSANGNAKSVSYIQFGNRCGPGTTIRTLPSCDSQVTPYLDAVVA